ncbi:site-2 protease family protein [Spirochaeta isovalerica]|uniref:Zn-dependent protease n=1 Tax=Spirochaeta isovalerica TaxID=150 RepID=A0A841R944_9SPIO|nr:site-2 protease family protein [Spirochaeta isovalerica]MBB6480423.1 Zn-dependent protease [Spirochaeta isovalerica]
MNIDIIDTLMNMTAFILAGSLHEWAHAFSAFIMGDRTAYDSGRMTLSPVAHVDLLGTVLFPLFRAFSGIPVIGWMKPVPVNPGNFRHQSKGMALSAAAGPLSNLLQASAAIILIKLLYMAARLFNSGLMGSLYEFFTLYYIINISLFLFNLLPIPPLDGSKILRHGLSAENRIRFDRISRYGGILLYLLLYAGFFRLILSPMIGRAYSLLFLFLSMKFYFAIIPFLVMMLITAIIYLPYLKNAATYLRFRNRFGTAEQAREIFEEQVGRTRSRNESLRKTAVMLLEKKKAKELNTLIDSKIVRRIEKEMTGFSRLCVNRTIDPEEDRCLECTYFANCLMRELELSPVSEKE